MADQHTEITREQLYDLVWSEPMTAVAPRLGVSDRALGKVCQRMKVPRPGVGYWQRREAGKHDRRPPLRPLPPGTEEWRFRWRPRPQREAATRTLDQYRLESLREQKIEVPERIGRYHHLVHQAAAALRTEQDSDREGHHAPRLDIQVSSGSRRRALRIMDTLIKALEGRGMRVTLDTARNRTLVDVSGTPVPIRLEERYKQVELHSGWPRWKRVATGQLALKIDSWSRDLRQTWADGKRQRLETCLESFVVGVVVFAEVERAHERVRQERERERLDRQRRIEEEKRREAFERKRAKEIRRQATEWDEADRLRAYVAAVRAKLEESNHTLGEVAEGWLRWAQSYIERLDPLCDPSAILVRWNEEPAPDPPSERGWAP